MTAARPSWRVRGAALAASCLCVAAFCYVLFLSSRQTLTDMEPIVGVEVMISPPPEREPPRRQPRDPRPTAAPSAAAPPATPSVDAQMLSRLLNCFGPRDDRRRDCPREPPAPDWASSEHRFTPGRDFAGEEPLDLNDAYTVAEQRTLVMPPCTGVCVPIGPTPPPPSRSAEEVCEAGGLGPCHPPPFRPEDVRRAP